MKFTACLVAVFLVVSVRGKAVSTDDTENVDGSSPRVKRCANLMDYGCMYGHPTGLSSQGDRDSNTKKQLNAMSLMDIFQKEMEKSGNPLRCANLMDDGCLNGQLPGSGGDGDYFGGGSNPGKRSPIPFLEIYQNKMENQEKTRRCANLLDDSCINGQLPGSGGDGDYFGGGSNPGKRSPIPFLEIYQNKMQNQGKTRRCANLLDDSCINGQLPGSGGDGDYFGGGSSPGRRSVNLEALLRGYCAEGHVVACRLVGL